MRTAQWARLVVLMFAVVLVVACAPAAPPNGAGDVSGSVLVPTEVPFAVPQSGDGEKEEPTATPYPYDCIGFKRPDNSEIMMVCPERGPRYIDQDLRKQYNVYMAEKERAAQDGRRSAPAPIMVDLLVSTSTRDAVDDVVVFLEENGVNVFGYEKTEGVVAAGYVHAMVSIELLEDIIGIEGVQGVWEVERGGVLGGKLQGTPVPAMTPAERTNVLQWHRAGITGAGVEVAVVDADFRDFSL